MSRRPTKTITLINLDGVRQPRVQGQPTQTLHWTLSPRASHLGVTGWVMMFYCSRNQTLLITVVSWPVTPKCDAYILEGQTTQTRSWTLSKKSVALGVFGYVVKIKVGLLIKPNNFAFLIWLTRRSTWPVDPDRWYDIITVQLRSHQETWWKDWS